jgi:hypothetical protein
VEWLKVYEITKSLAEDVVWRLDIDEHADSRYAGQ